MTDNIEQNLLNFLVQKKHYHLLLPEGLISPAFPDTFSASGFHLSVRNAVQNGTNNIHESGIEWCFRHVDIEKIGISPCHLTSFRMGVFYDVLKPGEDDTIYRNTVIQTFVECVELLGLDRNKISVTTFGGGKIQGSVLPADNEVVKLWEKNGIRNIIPVPGAANFTNIKRLGEPAGPRCEVFYTHPNFLEPVEIGTVVFERYILGEKLDPANGFVYGGALGIERLVMLSENERNIFECSLLKNLQNAIMSEIDEKQVSIVNADVYRLTDALRTLIVLFSAVNELPKGKRGERMKKIAKIARESFAKLGLNDLKQRGNIIGSFVKSINLYELNKSPKELVTKSVVSLVK